MNLSRCALFPTFGERKSAAVVIVDAVLAFATLAIYLPAEANRFSEAIDAAEKARLLAEAAKEDEIAARNAKLMELYRAQKPCRDMP